MFYGFVDKEEKEFLKYTIIDLDVFRDQEGGMVAKKFTNHDENPTKFLVYNYKQFGPGLVKKQWVCKKT